MSGGARVVRVAGALAEARPMRDASLYELVRVGEAGLLGEVIRLSGDRATIQVFEETSGLAVDEPVEATGRTLTAELGPGLLGATLDGVGRPLEALADASGPFVDPGARAVSLDRGARWTFEAGLRPGTKVSGGDVLGEVEERPGFRHRVMVPPGVTGTLAELASGSFTVEEVLGRLEDGTPLRLAHRWPVRTRRPAGERLAPVRPFLTGQRVLDFLFPVAEGGSVAVPGGFGTGKTVIEQSLAKFGAADVVVYIGCGERGNEMAEMLDEFPQLRDPRTGRPVMDRTVLVVNTSNMPVVAREASVYMGFTMAEYFRDMGYRTALMADSLSRWAEALREIGSRLRQMPGEEGYPTYLANRLARLFERSGRVRTPGRPSRQGALTFICAVSPPGGDFSEPVTQATLRVAGALWALDADLAHQRHYPAVDWSTSYSLYAERMSAWFGSEVGEAWGGLRAWAEELLQEEQELREIAGLVGPEALEDEDRLALETARILREIVLAQNAFDPVDAFCPAPRTLRLGALTRAFQRAGTEALEAGRDFGSMDVGAARRAIARVRDAPEGETAARAEEAREALAAAFGAAGEGDDAPAPGPRPPEDGPPQDGQGPEGDGGPAAGGASGTTGPEEATP
jgi:V/A-type H+-transporting ATPase subunit A